MNRPSDRAIAQAFWETDSLDGDGSYRFEEKVIARAREIDAAEPEGAQFVTGTVEAVGSDENGQPRILIHSTREALRDGPMLACRDVYVSTAPPSLGGEDKALREDAERYRWLRENCGYSGSGPHTGAQVIVYYADAGAGRHGIAYTGPRQRVGIVALDAAIDAARAAEGGECE